MTDPIRYGKPEIYVPDASGLAKKVEGVTGVSFGGIPVHENRLVPEGTALIVDTARLEALTFQMELAQDAYDDLLSGSRVAAEALRKFRLTFDDTVEERDPMERLHRWMTWRQILRLMRDIVGYEFRKASGTLRRYPRSISMVTGLTA